jgi:hypothetical protein
LSKNEEKTSIPRTKSGAEKKSYPMGEMLNDCSGWSIFKKTLPDGRIVYNAKIKAETPKNRGDWATIKGEIYTDTTFKWGRFGAFERWGNIPNESETIEKLCQILGKYYESGEQPAPSEEPKVDPSLPEVGDRFFVKTEGGQTIYEIMKMEMGTVFVQPDGSEWDVPYSFADAKNNFAEGRWVKIQDEEAEETPAPEAPKKSKEDIEKAIKGLQFLADKGNEKAKKAIIGLKILLNK